MAGYLENTLKIPTEYAFGIFRTSLTAQIEVCLSWIKSAHWERAGRWTIGSHSSNANHVSERRKL